MPEQWGLVALPRKWVNDCILSTAISIFGNKLTTKFPLRQILFHDLTAREQMERVNKP